MIFIGDFFALGLVAILCFFFFDSKTSIRHMSAASKLFICCLFATMLTAVVDLITGQLLILEGVPLRIHILVNTLYFVVNIISTSFISLYGFTKILEHSHSRHCMRNAYIGLSVLFCIYMFFVISNLWNGWLFYFDADCNYCRGPLYLLGYWIALAQLVLVVVCFCRNLKRASYPVRRVFIQMFPIVPLCIIIQIKYPEIMLNAFIMSLVETTLLLSFQAQRQGVHTLTKLNDRYRFFQELDYRMANKEPFQIFLINIKKFGSINRKYGHMFGDEYLYQFAFSLEKMLSGGLSYHMNGTVFATIMRYTYQSTADRQCGELLDFLHNGMQCMDQHVAVDYVLTHYVSDGTETSAAELYEDLEYACKKCHDAQQCYIRCTSEVREEMARRRYLRERIQNVDKMNGFEVWFQPIQHLSTGNFCSMEALVRLREPDGTLIDPAEFITLAVQSGHISLITWFVVEEVCRLLKSTPELENVSVSINLPIHQLLEKGFVPRFISTVNQAGVDPSRICLEVTEQAIQENFRLCLGIMQQLNQAGFRFYLDDFGVGYSNFNRLLQLPFQIIKLDSSLVHSKKNGIQDYTMVGTLTKLFHDMDLEVIAEGAETEEEVQILESYGVDRIQGFALAQPMQVDALIKFYQEHPMD